MEDSIEKKKTVLQSETEDETAANSGSSSLRTSGKHDALLPISVVGGFIGMLAGTLPAAFWALIFGVSFTPLYVFLPLLVYLGIKIFKGYSGKRGFIMTCIFSVIGIYLTFLSCEAAAFIIKYKMLFLNLPLVTATLVGKSEGLPGPLFSSAYIFPLLFTSLGVLLTYQLMMRKNEPAAVHQLEPRVDTE